jgi:hypothetical protein
MVAITRGLVYALVTLALTVAGSPGTAAAQIPLTACGVLAAPGNYLLTTNLSSAGTCFVIGANGVGLDLGNHTIRGNGTGSAIGDGGTARRSIVITRGQILNFQTGVDLAQSTNVTIEKLRVQRNVGSGIVIGPSPDSDACCSTIASTVASDNGGDGIFVGNCCNTFTAVRASGNTGHGIRTQQCCSTITDSAATRIGGHGFFTQGCCSTVNESSAEKNGGDGIVLNDCCGSVTASKSEDNGGRGISSDSCCNQVKGCQASGNDASGIDFPAGGFHSVTASTARKNTEFGVRLGGSDARNHLTGVQATGNLVGASIQCPSTVLRLTAADNIVDDLELLGAGCAVLNSTAP